MKEALESRKKVVHIPGERREENGEEMTNISKMTVGIKEFMKAKHMDEQKARDDGLRVEKETRKRLRFFCCACEKLSKVNHNRECSACEHHRCPECIVETELRT